MPNLLDMSTKFDCRDDAETAIEQYSGDSMNEDYNYIFFYGHIIAEHDWIIGDRKISDKAYYSCCPSCKNLFKLKKKPCDGDYVECPECRQEGSIYNFRDINNQPCDMLMENRYAYIERLDRGYVLRLYRVGLDYSDREYDDWTTLTCFPNASIIEYGREYWYNGKVECYENVNDSQYGKPDFVMADTIDDSNCYIINYEEPLDCMFDSSTVEDLIYKKPNCNTFMSWKSQQLSYNVFTTLAKYGFDKLLAEYIEVTSLFEDSSKISQIMGVDYNKIKSQFAVENVGYVELLGLRKLKENNIELTENNLSILINADDKFDLITAHQPVKTLKYLRNIMNKHGVKIVRDYIDYLLACNKLNNDIANCEVRMPSNFVKAHDTTLGLIKLAEVKIYDIPIESIYKNYYGLCEWNDGNLTVLMAKNSEEIIQEGIRQNHCVGNYCERVGRAESIILFVRRLSNIDESFYTMEIRPDMKKLNVIQCRGYHNEDKSKDDAKDIVSFLKKYTKWFNKRSSKGVDNKNIIAKYYKAVQNVNGKYISNYDHCTEYKIGEIIETECDDNPDKVHVKGIHIASLEFATRYGGGWSNVAILEVEVNLNDVIVPDAKDQIRASKVKVLRVMPPEELGEWGKRVA